MKVSKQINTAHRLLSACWCWRVPPDPRNLATRSPVRLEKDAQDLG